MTERDNSNSLEENIRGYKPSELRDPKLEPKYERPLIYTMMIAGVLAMGTYLFRLTNDALNYNSKSQGFQVVSTATQPSQELYRK